MFATVTTSLIWQQVLETAFMLYCYYETRKVATIIWPFGRLETDTFKRTRLPKQHWKHLITQAMGQNSQKDVKVANSIICLS